MNEQFQIEKSVGSKPEHRVFKLAGTLNLVTVPGFLDAMKVEKAPAVILDFSDVTMVDSAGVGSLIQTYIAFQNTKRRLALVGMSPRILAVLEITRVKSLLPIFGTLAEAEQKLT